MKRKGRWGWKVVLVIVIGAVFFCYRFSRLTVFQSYPAEIYFPDKNALFLVPVTRFSSAPVTPQFLLEELEKGPQDQANLLSVFPNDIVPSIQISGKIIVVNLKDTGSLENWPMMMVPSLLGTFKQLSGYDTVEFLVNGQANSVVGGEELGTESLRDFSINDNAGFSKPQYLTGESQKITLYFRLTGTKYLVPVTVHASPTKSAEEEIVEEFEDNSRLPWVLQSPLPQGTEIVSVTRPEDRIIDAVVSVKGKERNLTRKALLLTFTSVPGVSEVRLRSSPGFFGWRCLQKRPNSVNIEARH